MWAGFFDFFLEDKRRPQMTKTWSRIVKFGAMATTGVLLQAGCPLLNLLGGFGDLGGLFSLLTSFLGAGGNA